ncbi:MAG: DUF2285 domain-containing protein, partial [Pseudomonadota bacterium]|nr:DUF2285 domain-containing protein [Pseudomonadota bacterium]
RPLKSAARLRECLRVLDGRRAGASPRQIAVALFGAAKVEEEWNHPNQRLRDHVRNARKRGEFLMEGGYRTLLFKS